LAQQESVVISSRGFSAVRADSTAMLNAWADYGIIVCTFLLEHPLNTLLSTDLLITSTIFSFLAVLEDADYVFDLDGDIPADAAKTRSETLVPSKKSASDIVSEVEEVNVSTPDSKTRGLDGICSAPLCGFHY
jgi:hypothetical protein